MMKSIVTRFRAYQLGYPGSSFSYFADGHFTIMEGRLTEMSRASLEREMQMCSVDYADALHITSWDSDHCNRHELQELLELVQPLAIECPGYDPYSDHGEGCLEIIGAYRDRPRNTDRKPRIEHVTPAFIRSLEEARRLGFKNVFHNPLHVGSNANDNSTVKHFRRGSFNVLSLGDVEDSNISARLRRSSMLRSETDVMILAHHGADNGFTNKPFLSRIEPALAICSADFDNKYDHPKQEIRDLLYEQGIRLMTTKTGDVVVKSTGDHSGRYRAINFRGNTTEISSQQDFVSKKGRILSHNADTIRQHYAGRRSYPR